MWSVRKGIKQNGKDYDIKSAKIRKQKHTRIQQVGSVDEKCKITSIYLINVNGKRNTLKIHENNIE